MHSIHSQYRNKISNDIGTEVNKVIINNVDEFTTGISSVINSNIVTVSLLLDGYTNPNITNIKVYDINDVLITDVTVNTSVESESYSDRFDFKFTIL